MYTNLFLQHLSKYGYKCEYIREYRRIVIVKTTIFTVYFVNNAYTVAYVFQCLLAHCV